jgi:hypothetical protein
MNPSRLQDTPKRIYQFRKCPKCGALHRPGSVPIKTYRAYFGGPARRLRSCNECKYTGPSQFFTPVNRKAVLMAE